MNGTFCRTASKYANPANLPGARQPIHLLRRPLHPTRPIKSLSHYSTAAQERGDDPAAHQFHINKTVVYIFVPCALAMYGFLTYLSAEQGGIRQRLFAENKTSGRAHGCTEVHHSDIDQWIKAHPEQAEEWKRIKEGYDSDHTATPA